MYDYLVIGGGIVGLATAARLARETPGARIAVVEKEDRWAAHQSGRNSGVIHSGIYYRPGSLKAALAREGNRSMVEYCRERGIAHEVCGKVIVATREEEIGLLEALYLRGLENAIEVHHMSREKLRQREPHASGRAALFVPSTGICDYRAVCESLASEVRDAGGDLFLTTEVESIGDDGDGRVVRAGEREIHARLVVACGGLQSDRLARLDGVDPAVRVVPFRGEYYELTEPRRDLVRALIYPVPDPRFPFLGVHFTRMIDGSVHAGPNAVLSLAREGYEARFSLPDARDTLLYPGFWRLATRHAAMGIGEMIRSFRKDAFVRALRKLLPEIEPDDLVPSTPGIRAQALRSDGHLVDDFLFVHGRRSLHVCNAPSPAATASLEIAKVIVREVSQRGAA